MTCLSGQYSQLEEEPDAELNECFPPPSSSSSSSCSSCWVETIPLELLRKVFLHLATDDLKVRFIENQPISIQGNLLQVAAQVCKRWREAVGSSGKLWCSSSIHINSNNISPLSTLMGSGMLTRLKVVEAEKVTEKLLEAMVKQEGLEEVNFFESDLSAVNPSLLANLVERLVKVNLGKTKLTHNQLEVLFNRLGENKTGLKGLNIQKNDLSSIQPAQLAGAVRGIGELWLGRSRLTEEQQLILAVHSLGDDTSINLNMDWGSAEGHAAFLWSFNLVHNDPKNLLPVNDILRSDSLWNVASLVVNNASSLSLTKELLQLLTTHANIKLLDFSYSCLGQVEPELLATLVTQAVQVNISGTDLTKKQLKSILLRISQEETFIERLNLSENDLSGIEPTLLASSLPRLLQAGLSFCQLSTAQVELLLGSLSHESSCLKHISLSDNYLKCVDPVLIGQSVVGLKTANLCGTKLSLHQISVALALIVHSTSLEEIALDLHQGLDYQEHGHYQEYLNDQDYLDYRDLIHEAGNRMTVREISKKQRKKEFFFNGPRVLKLLNDYNL